MKPLIVSLGTSIALAGCATGPKEEDHAAHHPPASATAAPVAASHGHMDSMMQSMREMHERVMAAKTPEERAALMQQHMKTMQDGMAMMRRMHGAKGGMGPGGGMSMGHEMMGKRMEMMETMMQMMVDREALKSPPAR